MTYLENNSLLPNNQFNLALVQNKELTTYIYTFKTKLHMY